MISLCTSRPTKLNVVDTNEQKQLSNEIKLKKTHFFSLIADDVSICYHFAEADRVFRASKAAHSEDPK